jgi:histidinol-phosphate aminotransferase
VPGYLALIDSAARVGGVGVPVPLNAQYENDLPALREKLSAQTRAYYLVNPHNPTGTVSDSSAFLRFLRDVSQHAPVIVDEAYLEFTSDFASRTATSVVKDGGNVLVFRTFDKIHGLAGLPIGYTLAPRKLASKLREQGLGDAESLGRLNITAASAALSDKQHVARIRDLVAVERTKWTDRLDALKLEYTHANGNFIYFNAKRPQQEFASLLLKQGVEIGRSFPPYTNWARITIGLPGQNETVWNALRKAVA